MRRGILDIYFGNEQNRLGKEQNSSFLMRQMLSNLVYSDLGFGLVPKVFMYLSFLFWIILS